LASLHSPVIAANIVAQPERFVTVRRLSDNQRPPVRHGQTGGVLRDQLLAAVKARLQRIDAAQDLALAWEPGAPDEAQRLANILRDDDGDLEARFMLG
jgi:hypothetical protein